MHIVVNARADAFIRQLGDRAIPGSLNSLARRGRLSIVDLAALGARQIGLASGIFNLVKERHDAILHALAEGASVSDL